MDLRPLTLAELLDRAFSIYRRHLWVFVGVMVPPALFAILVAVSLQVLNGTMMSQVGNPHPSPDQVFRTLVPFFSVAFIAGTLNIFVYAMAVGAMSVAVSQVYLGREATVKLGYAAVRDRAGRLTLVVVLVVLRVFGLFVAGGIVLALIAGAVGAAGSLLGPIGALLGGLAFLGGMLVLVLLVVFLMTRYSVSIPAAMLEDSTAAASIRRSIDLTRENLGRVFLVILCAFVVAYATGLLLQGPFVIASFITGGPVTATGRMLALCGAVAGGIGQMFSGPVMTIGLVLMYYDLRIRKEAFDLHMMLESVGR